jgi:hypothetical protein
MKYLRKISLIILLGIGALGALSFSSDLRTIPTNVEVSESVACRFSQCTATAKSTGQRCKHCVSNAGDSKCWQHK